MAKLQLFNRLLTSTLKNKACIPNHKCWDRLTVNLCENVRMVHVGHHLKTSNENKGAILVYEGPLKRRIKIVKLISLSSSMLGFAILPVVLKDMFQVNIFLAGVVGIISSGFLCTPLLLHWITKRYVIELNFDTRTETFAAKTYNIVSQETEIKFNADDVTVPEIPGMLTSFKVKDYPLFVDANIVKDPDAYSLMMGYDKPYDFKLESEKVLKQEKST